MPYNSQGVFVPVTGAENAAPGQVIRSVTWNSIFTDISTALTQVGQRTPGIQTSRTIAGGSFTVLITDVQVFVSGSSPTILLPAASLMQAPVKILGAASTVFGSNNSVVLPSGADTLSGQPTLTLAANYQIATFYPSPYGGWVVGFA